MRSENAKPAAWVTPPGSSRRGTSWLTDLPESFVSMLGLSPARVKCSVRGQEAWLWVTELRAAVV